MGGAIFTSTGTGSLLDLSSLTSINAGFNDASSTVRVQQINATGGGVINLSGVTAITSPMQSTDRLDFNINSGGVIDLSSLATVGGNGLVVVNMDGANGGATMKLGSLEAAHRTFFTLTNGAMAIDGGLAAVGTPGLISDSTFSVSGGSKFTAATVATSYSSTGLFLGGAIFTSTGTGSLLDLSSLTSINAGFNDASSTVRVQQINATGGGVINLSGVTAITSPVQSTDRLDFNVNSGGVIDLSALKTIGGAGQLKVTMDGANGGATMKLGSLEAAHRTFFTLTNGAMVIDGGLAAVGTPGLISDSTFSVSSGSKFMAATVATSYSSTGLFLGGAIFTSTGSGSLLDLSSLTSMNAGFDDFSSAVRVQRVNATGGGVINLSGVTSITSPVQSTDRLDFNINSGGEIDLSALTTIGGAGLIRFVINGGTLSLGPLHVGSRVTFDLDSQAKLQANGGVVLASTLQVEIDAPMTAGVDGEFSEVNVTGPVTLAGVLDIDLINSFLPNYFDEFQIVSATSRTGEFDHVTGALINPDKILAPVYDHNGNTGLTLVAALPGDANLDGTVNGDDLLRWQANLFSSDEFVQGDFNLDGTVNGDDLLIWQSHLFDTVPIPATATAPIPEPGTGSDNHPVERPAVTTPQRRAA